MATIQFSALVNQIRGKFNGSQFSVNRAGALLQVKATQRVAPTARQSQSRSVFSFVARHWNTLSAIDKDLNNQAVEDYPYTDKYGNRRVYTGYALLLRSNLNRNTLGLPLINVVPTPPPAGALLLQPAFLPQLQEGGEATIEAFWNFTATDPGEYVVQIFNSNALNSSAITYSGAYWLAGSFPLTQAMPLIFVINNPSTNIWEIGLRVYFEIYVIHAPSGIVVATYIDNSVITAF